MHSNPVLRRRHSADLKVKVLAACNEPGASIAAVALSHGRSEHLRVARATLDASVLPGSAGLPRPDLLRG